MVHDLIVHFLPFKCYIEPKVCDFETIDVMLRKPNNVGFVMLWNDYKHAYNLDNVASIIKKRGQFILAGLWANSRNFDLISLLC